MLTVGEALARQDVPLMFVEDFIGSGQQSVSILEAWLGEAPTTRLREDRESLSEAAANQFRQAATHPYSQRGLPTVSDCSTRCSELGLSAEVFVASENAPRAFAGERGDRRERLRELCAEIGHALLLDADAGHDDEWVKDKALGYGDNGFLVLFGYNTPTQTLTCIWKDGEFRELPWMPLFPRRPKR